MGLTRGVGTRNAVQTIQLAGEAVDIPAFMLTDATGNVYGSSATYQLAGTPGTPLASLGAGAATTAITIPAGGSASYGWSYILSGTSPSLKLQALGADGTTWQDVATVTASGAQGVVIFTGSAGAQMRVFNAGANPITSLSSQLSS